MTSAREAVVETSGSIRGLAIDCASGLYGALAYTLRVSTAYPFLALLVLGSTATLVAQEPGDEADFEAFAETVQVNVVNVDVYVTDKAGRPVTDLTVEDFEVLENRRPMEITNFFKAVDGERTDEIPTLVAPEAQLPPPTEPTPLAAAPPPIAEDRRLRLVIFVDNFNIRPLERRRIMDELRGFIYNHLRRDDLAMLVTNDRSFKVRHPFTSDPAAIVQALEELNKVRGEGGRHDSERQRILRRFDEFDNSEEALSAVRRYSETVFHDVNASIDVMKNLVDFLAGLPGRKAVLHVSSGIQMVAGLDLLSGVEQKFEASSAMTEMFSYDASRRFEELGTQANANGITFYMLDAGGLRPDMTGSAAEQGIKDTRVSARLGSDNQANLQSPLYFLADETGGVAIVNQNNVAPALERIAGDFRTFYSLGYSPRHYGTGRRYSIRVKVNRKGLRVRHRQSYRDKSSDTRMTEGTRAALLHGFEDNPLNISLVFGRTVEDGEGAYLVPVQVQIPVASLVLLPTPRYHAANVQLFVAAMSEDGGLSDVQRVPMGIKIPNEQLEAARSERWLYTHRLRMGPGRQSVAIGVLDELGSQPVFLTRSLVVGKGR